MTYQSVQKKTRPMDMLRVSGKGITVAAGGPLPDPHRDQVDYKKNLPEIQFVHIPGYGRVEYQFLIEGKGEVTFSFESKKAGRAVKTLALE